MTIHSPLNHETDSRFSPGASRFVPQQLSLGFPASIPSLSTPSSLAPFLDSPRISTSTFTIRLPHLLATFLFPQSTRFNDQRSIVRFRRFDDPTPRSERFNQQRERESIRARFTPVRSLSRIPSHSSSHFSRFSIDSYLPLRRRRTRSKRFPSSSCIT